MESKFKIGDEVLCYDDDKVYKGHVIGMGRIQPTYILVDVDDTLMLFDEKNMERNLTRENYKDYLNETKI